MQPTKVQQYAIDTHDRNLIVMAGAGSGKTRVLVERYIQLLKRNPAWSLNALVAITFTQKAAQEMRDRVRAALQAEFMREPGNPVWAQRIAAMDSARIDTIHALCASILRANAAAAKVDPGFAVLDETQAAVMLDDVIESVLRSLPGDESAALFREYERDAVLRVLRAFAAREIAAPPADLKEAWRSSWETNAQDALSRLLTAPECQPGWQPAALLPSGADKLMDVWLGGQAHLSALRGAGAVGERIESLHRLIAVIDLRGGAEKAWGGKDALKGAKDALKRLREASSAAALEIGMPPDAPDERAARFIPLWHALIAQVCAAYRAAKADAGALDFDDLENETCRLLQDPRVAARYRGGEFRHVLVDEFQDTNAAQWQIVKALADPAVPGCLFVVGDAKQSIYQFRGADVSVFEAVQGEITAAGGEKLDMTRSFRTHGALVDGFNALFDRLLVREDSSPARAYQIARGAPMQAERADAPGDAPPIEVLLFDRALEVDGEKLDSVERRAWEGRELARRIREIVTVECRPVYDKARRTIRPIQYGDVALLFQAMTHSTLYEEALKAEGLPYVSTAGRGYYDRQEVWDLLNLLKALYNPSDDLALASALRSPLFSLSDDALLALRFERGDRLWDALGDEAAALASEQALIRFAHDTLRDLRVLAGRVTIHELLIEALERTGYLAVLSGLPDGARRRGNVEKLLEKARTSGKITLGAFAVYVEDLSAREVREGEAMLDSTDAVRLMTVHKSKGLEFPLVVLVDASYEGGRRGGRDPLVYDAAAGWACTVYDDAEGKHVPSYAYRYAERLAAGREDAERRRLLYVAATRAQDYLLISGAASWDKKSSILKADGWLGWLIAALDMTDHPREAQTRRAYAWGSLSVRCCLELAAAFDVLSVPMDVLDAQPPLPVSADAPPLIAPLTLDMGAAFRSLTATQIADMGSALHGTPHDMRPRYRERLRRSVIGDAPARLERANVPKDAITFKKIGDIVHQAIRDDLPDDRHALEDLLGCRAWEQGIVTDEACAEAVMRAYGLLQKVKGSDVFRWISEAKQVLREVPFIYHTERRAIHGQIDLLIQHPDERWAIIDYKTSRVAGVTLTEHARQYLPQVGVYAAAVSALLGSVPLVYIHYIRHEKTVTVAEADWRAALARIEDDIGSLLG